MPQSACPEDLILRTAEPLNAETPLSLLAASWITPQERFFIRTHGDVPELDAATHVSRWAVWWARHLDLSLTEPPAEFSGSQDRRRRCFAPVTGARS